MQIESHYLVVIETKKMKQKLVVMGRKELDQWTKENKGKSYKTFKLQLVQISRLED